MKPSQQPRNAAIPAQIVHYPTGFVEVDGTEGVILLTNDEYTKALRRGHSRTEARRASDARLTPLVKLLAPWTASTATLPRGQRDLEATRL